MLASSDVRLNCDYLKHRDELNAIAKKDYLYRND